MTEQPFPGEARTRQRKRHQVLICTFSGTLGGVIASIAAFTDPGDASLFTGKSAELAFDHFVAVALALAVALAFIVVPLWCFTLIVFAVAWLRSRASPDWKPSFPLPIRTPHWRKGYMQ